jgi:hypothetical protein
VSDLELVAPNTLGIGAASFASFFGQQTTDNRQQIFLSEEKTNASKDIAESPTACRNAQKISEIKNFLLVMK